MSARPTLADVAVGDELPGIDVPLQRADLVRYAGASGDFNPIHWDEGVAREVGLPGVIAHGMLTMGSAVRIVTQWCGDPGAVLDYGVKFTNPVPVPERGTALVAVAGRVAAVDADAGTVRVDLTATVTPDGAEPVKVLGRAQAVVRLP